MIIFKYLYKKIMFSATYGYKKIVALLLKNNAKVNAVSKEGLEALNYACLNDKIEIWIPESLFPVMVT